MRQPERRSRHSINDAPSAGTSLIGARPRPVHVMIVGIVVATIGALAGGTTGWAIGRLEPARASGHATWSLQSVPNPPVGVATQLNGVSCVAASSCAGVGVATSHTIGPLAERWNGTTWASTPAPSPASSRSSVLNDVSCTLTTNCLAVGERTIATGATRSLTERWNGKAWAIVSSANPQDATYVDLNAVSCAGSSCEAVGFTSARTFHDVALAEHWNGRTWTVQAVARPSTASLELGSVSCRSASWCLAVGHTVGARVGTSFAERWNGARWSLITAPKQAGGQTTFLRSVSCTSTHSCVVVGDVAAASGTSTTLALQWDGATWSKIATPNVAHTTTDILESVDCMTGVSCVAVGVDAASSKGDKTLVERRSGASWTVMASPNPSGAASSQVVAVSCTAQVACESVGTYTASSRTRSFAERYVGLLTGR